MFAVDLDRLREAMHDADVDQSALARAVGCTPGAINQILVGRTRRSKYLPEIAAVLGVSYGWLVGRHPVKKTVGGDDPDESRPPLPPAPLIQHVMMAVALPPEYALARMFDVLLAGLPARADRDFQARLLAQRLPIALGQIRDLLPQNSRAPRRAEVEESEEALATHHHESTS